MVSATLKKSAIANQLMAEYLLTLSLGDKLAPLTALSKKFKISVGLLQQTLKSLEQKEIIVLQRRGHLGSYLTTLNLQRLLHYCTVTSLLCVMPLPYTKRYEGLANGLRENLLTLLPVNFAFMQGATLRADYLNQGFYHYAVVSELAANQLLTDYPDLIIAKTLSPHSYVAHHQLIATNHNPKKIAIDERSLDHRYLTYAWQKQQPHSELIPITYNEIVPQLLNGNIDGAIVNSEGNSVPESLLITDLPISETLLQANRAVLLCRRDNHVALIIAQQFICIEEIEKIQDDVISGIRIPRY